jgi:hypothetical protein
MRSRAGVDATHNNGMHPTPLQRVCHDSCVGARVMPGVRPPVANHTEEMFWLTPHVRSIERKQLRVARLAL